MALQQCYFQPSHLWSWWSWADEADGRWVEIICSYIFCAHGLEKENLCLHKPDDKRAVCSSLTSPGFQKSKVIHFWKSHCHLEIWMCKVESSFSQWKLAPQCKGCAHSQNWSAGTLPLIHTYFWNYSHFYLLSKVSMASYSMGIYWPCHLLCIVCGQMN